MLFRFGRLSLLAGLAVCLCSCSSSQPNGSDTATSQTDPGNDSADADVEVNVNPDVEVEVETDDSVLQRNHHASRDANFLQPLLTADAIATMAPDTDFNAAFAGNMWASPLYMVDGPGHVGTFFAVTTSNDVLALDENTGDTIWTANIGPAAAATGVSCGNIHPLGIISTPIIDASTRTIYVAGAIGTDTIERHEVHALNVDDGTERAGFPVDVTGMQSGDQIFAAPPENQRSALSLVNGILYVTYGGHVGDCGPYHGWVVGIDTTDPSQRGAWATLGQGEGIWSPGGMPSDGQSVFAVTGNSTVLAADRTVSDSEQVVRLNGLAEVTRSDTNLFFPSIWKQMDSDDADFSAANAIYLSIPGSTPKNYIAAIAKDGTFYLLNSSHLGGMGGEVTSLSLATQVHSSPATYTTQTGVHYVVSTNSGAMCPPNGPTTQDVVVSVLLNAGSPPTPVIEWCAPMEGKMVTGVMATTSDGMSDPTVWYTSDGKLTAVDGETGEQLYQSAEACANVRKWTTPIAVKGRIVAGGDNHLCSWSPH
jgi:outer membrane protein assembly factor BamB